MKKDIVIITNINNIIIVEVSIIDLQLVMDSFLIAENSKTKYIQPIDDDNEFGVFSNFTSVSTKINISKRSVIESTNNCLYIEENQDDQEPYIKNPRRLEPYVLENTNCEQTAKIEELFLQRFQFREYDKERDLNSAPTVVHSRALNKRTSGTFERTLYIRFTKF